MPRMWILGLLSSGRQMSICCRLVPHKVQLLATLRAPGKLPSFFRAVSFLRRVRVFPERELALAFLTGHLEVLDVALTAPRVKSADRMRRMLDIWRKLELTYLICIVPRNAIWKYHMGS
jgi:Dor1-like family protein